MCVEYGIIIFPLHICQAIVWCYISYVLAICYFLHPLCQVPLPACGSLKLSLQPLPLRTLPKQDRITAFFVILQILLLDCFVCGTYTALKMRSPLSH